MAIFKTRAAADQFAKEEPFILEGLVKFFTIREAKSLARMGVRSDDCSQKHKGNLPLFHERPLLSERHRSYLKKKTRAMHSQMPDSAVTTQTS